MTAAAVVVSPDADYSQGGARDLTQTPNGRLRVDTASSNAGTVTTNAVSSGEAQILAGPQLGRKFLQIFNTGANPASVFLGASVVGIPIAAGGTLFGSTWTPTDQIQASSASGTTLIVVSG